MPPKYEVSNSNLLLLHNSVFRQFSPKQVSSKNNISSLNRQKFFCGTCKFERGEWALVEAPQVVELDAFRVDAGGEDESFGVEGGDGPAGQLHESLALV